jgi:hypothetical protein
VLEISVVRQRLVQAINRAKQEAVARRTEHDLAANRFDRFLEEVAGPVARQFASALRAEGYPFQVATPTGLLRLESVHARDDVIEIALDVTERPVVVGRTSRGRGRRIVAEERPLREGAAIENITQEDVLAYLLAVIPPFVER